MNGQPKKQGDEIYVDSLIMEEELAPITNVFFSPFFWVKKFEIKLRPTVVSLLPRFSVFFFEKVAVRDRKAFSKKPLRETYGKTHLTKERRRGRNSSPLKETLRTCGCFRLSLAERSKKKWASDPHAPFLLFWMLILTFSPSRCEWALWDVILYISPPSYGTYVDCRNWRSTRKAAVINFFSSCRFRASCMIF